MPTPTHSIKTKKALLEEYKGRDGAQTGAEAARRVGVPTATANRWISEAGIKKDPTIVQRAAKGVSEETVDRAVSLYKRGLSYKEVAEVLGRSKTSIMRWIQSRDAARSQSEAQKVANDRNGYKERALRTCRLRAERPDWTWTRVAKQLPWSETSCRRHWNSRHNPYRSGSGGSPELTPADS